MGWPEVCARSGGEDYVYRSRTMGGRMSAAFRVVGTCPVVGVVTAPPLSLRAVL